MFFPRPRPVLLAALSLVIALLCAPAVPAAADSPTRMPEQLVDAAQVLDRRQHSEVTAALARLSDDGDLQLWVIYVRDFGDLSAQEWGQKTEELSELGYRDVLLAISVDDKSYYLGSAEPIEGLPAGALREVAESAAAPAIRDGRWAAAALDTADELHEPSSRLWLWLGGVLVLLVLAAAAAFTMRRRRTARAAAQLAEASGEVLTVDELARQPLEVLEPWSSELLVHTDNAVSISGDELTLAVQESGPDAVADYTDALTAAEAAVVAAFRLRRMLDEQSGLAAAERRSLLVEIISMCADANSGLDARAPGFDAVRRLLDQPAPRLDALAERAAAMPDDITAARDDQHILERRFGGPVAESVHGNIDLAIELVQFADDALAQGRDAIADAADLPDQTLAAIRSAECALDTAGRLLDAVTDVRGNLALIGDQSEGSAVATAHVAAAESFIDTRRGAVGTAARTCLSEAERLLSEAGPNERAIALATEALALGRQDVAAWKVGHRDDGAPVLTGVLVDVVISQAEDASTQLGSGGFSSGGRSPGSFGGADTSGRIGTGGRR
ncbi:hypothetical protein GOHSU_60_00100 [Gordonia hirsuta DSM 44140 = NBRC 16056]|uniref:TPM domain-containing protein n=1 Tax=Gordonia hirsuta DSM 44140 = NBRC 16056 TaxID=1121927 RepID=L7LFS6_9ACTN|nr:TPM domain-containing protein [Gordonia hirsuta]GAC58932.1 hypothetical protein GOHSU_60_00100 [Gordonia hirsuta DSM 44140 = NBRC 16056]